MDLGNSVQIEFNVAANKTLSNMVYISLYLPAAKKYEVRMKIFITAAVFHLLVSMILTPFYQIYGIVLSVILTESFLLLLGYYYFKRGNVSAKNTF